VNPTVQLDHQCRFCAVEIYNKAIDNMLAAKLKAKPLAL